MIETETHAFTLQVLRAGADEKNYAILEACPTTVEKIMREHRITKMPANRRVNQLASAGLVQRELGTGVVRATPLARAYLALIRALTERVQEEHLALASVR